MAGDDLLADFGVHGLGLMKGEKATYFLTADDDYDKNAAELGSNDTRQEQKK